MAGPLVVSDDSGLRRIVADKRGGAVRPTAASFDALLNRARGNKARFLLKQISRERAQRRDVIDNPDAAAMRPEDEIILARLDRKIAHGHRGKATPFELRPPFPAID